jgi:decaprenyl-phosphate phosphoribosyltransferase
VTMSYSLWAFELSEQTRSPLPAISLAPFVIGVLRYAVDIDRGDAGSPEDIVLRDRVLQLVGLVWAVTFIATVTVR